MDEIRDEMMPSAPRPREVSVLRRLCRVVAGFRRVLRQELGGSRALAGQIATETRLLAELLALPAAEIWKRFGAESEAWSEVEPLLALDLLQAVGKRAELGEPEASELAWLVVMLALRLRTGQLREDFQRDLIAEGLLVLAELRWEAGDGAMAARFLRLAQILAASGSRSLSIKGRLEVVSGLLEWSAGDSVSAIERLERACTAFREDGDSKAQAVCLLWLELVWARTGQADEAEAARRLAKRLLGREVEAVAAGVGARLCRAELSRRQREDRLRESA